jgi:hypothetical protein
MKSHPAKKKYNHCNKIRKNRLVEEYDTSQSPSLMQARDGGNRKELQGIVKVCLFILCLVLRQDLWDQNV